jgi:hypothetical protein
MMLGGVSERFSRHGFVDRRQILGVPNFADVVSNLPFLFVGVWGLLTVARMRHNQFLHGRERLPWLVLFAGVVLVAFGSAYYHLAPSDERLVWDRVPMTIAFSAFFCAMVAERVSVKLGIWGLAVLVPLAIASVFHWYSSGDLRPYMMVQLGPMLLVPFLLVAFPARYSGGGAVLVVLALYVLAKIAELFDAQLFALLGGISGHSLKHIIAAVGLVPLIRMLRARAAVTVGA